MYESDAAVWSSLITSILPTEGAGGRHDGEIQGSTERSSLYNGESFRARCIYSLTKRSSRK